MKAPPTTDEPQTRRHRRWPSPTTRGVLLWGLLMAPLLLWGLPSSRNDDLLFGGETPWPAERYNVAADLEALQQRDAGADTDLNPLASRDRRVDLTSDDDARAEILRRYRLFSRQPDEMIILRALQRMRPRALDLDPRLYQYGGGYIYLVGASIGTGAALRLVQVTRDAGVYLERPESFAAFYVAARAVSLVFGALTLIAIHRLARRAGGRGAGWLATLAVALSPVFFTAVLEAKPHLPSACMILWATLSALDYQAHGRQRSAVWMGLQAGYALGLVLTGVVAALLWPTLLLTIDAPRRQQAWRHLGIAALLAIGVYVLTNPYVPYNWLFNRAALQSNIGNSTAMYEHQMEQAVAGAVRIAHLLPMSAGAGVLFAGAVGLIALLRRHPRPVIVAVVAGVAMLLICVLLGAGKPDEFARFLVLPVLLLCIAAGWILAKLICWRPLLGSVVGLVVLATSPVAAYVRAFAVDARGNLESRRMAGDFLSATLANDDVLGVLQEPAPYAVPPADFTRRRVVYLPPLRPAELDEADLPSWLVFTADDERAHAAAWWQEYYRLEARFPAAGTRLSPICWADKPVFIYCRQ